MTSPKEIEAGLLSSVADADCVRLAEEAGVTAESFVTTEPDHAAVWEYIAEHARRTGGAPAAVDLERLHGFEAAPPGDLEAYIKLVRQREIARRARAALWRHGADIDAKPEETIAALVAELAGLRIERARRRTLLDRDAPERLKAFDEIRKTREAGEFIGLPTGLASLDSGGVGLLPGQLAIVMGTTGVGKSWVLMRMAVEAYRAGKKILWISPEMTSDEQGARFDVVAAASLGLELSNTGIAEGKADREEYAKWLESLAGRADFECIDSSERATSITFEDVWRYAAEFRPDEVIVDGLHLLALERSGRPGWEILKEGIEQLKAMAQHERVVVLAAQQAQRGDSKELSLPPALHQVGYGYSTMQTANTVISLAYERNNPLQRAYIVTKMRGGRTIAARRILHFDVDHGRIHELETDEPDASAFGKPPDF